ncbi:hypothetical protein [Streptomyces zaomyceticus]|uniref:hypothetical protein n=1 Tax=Streptomyces zaomyceticus TaxID=68286 RepID=UPI003422CD1F
MYDKVLTLGADGHLTVPVRRMERLGGYRITVGPAGAPAPYPPKCEAEAARQNRAVLHLGSDTALDSGRGYIGGVDVADSSVSFTVHAAQAGIHVMTVRYANGTGAESRHTVRVGTENQGEVVFPAAGANTMTLGKGSGDAELDYADVRSDTHRYEAELAAVTDADLRHYRWNEFPDYVGGIDRSGASVEFTVGAPRSGSYLLDVGYANGTPDPADHVVTVDGAAAGRIAMPSTAAWLDTERQDAVARGATLRVTSHEDLNRVRLAKGTGYAELDWLALRLD